MIDLYAVELPDDCWYEAEEGHVWSVRFYGLAGRWAIRHMDTITVRYKELPQNWEFM